MKKILTFLNNIKERKPAKIFIILLRIIIGLSFILPGIPKILGHRFTLLTPDTPIGFFFEAMYQTGFYWNFLGWVQIITGLLLISQRFSALGTMLYFPVILNIFVITASMHFRGTPYITFMMLMAGLLFIVWDYDKFKYILTK